jgi:hypothetical protein
MSTKRKKRGVGRPKLEPMSGPELREKARAGIRRTTERQLKRNEIDVPTFVEEVEAVTGKHKFTRAEMDELRRKVDLLYNEYVLDKWETEEKENKEINAKLHERMLEQEKLIASSPTMSPEQWHLAHGRRPDGSKRRGPAPKKKKTVWDLAPGECGIAEKPGEPIDFEQMDQEFEEKMMEDYIAQRNSEPQQHVGKRLRKDHLNPPKRPNVKYFWV